MDAIVVDRLSYRYQAVGGNTENISFKVAPGDRSPGWRAVRQKYPLYVSVVLSPLSGRHADGQVLINGKDTKEYRVAQLALEVGLVSRSDTQLFAPTVEDEIAFAPENLCLPVEEVATRVDNVLDTLGLPL